MKIEIGVVSGCWQAKCCLIFRWLALCFCFSFFFCEWKNNIKIKSNKYKDESIEDIKTPKDKRWKKLWVCQVKKVGNLEKCRSPSTDLSKMINVHMYLYIELYDWKSSMWPWRKTKKLLENLQIKSVNSFYIFLFMFHICLFSYLNQSYCLILFIFLLFIWKIS